VTTYLSGLMLGLALIVPIGPQNIVVLNQGLVVGLPKSLFAAAFAGICDTVLIVVGAVGVGALLAGVPLASMCVNQDAVRAGVVEQVLGKQDDRLNQVVFDEPLSDVPFLVRPRVAAAPAGRPRVQDDRHPAPVVQRSGHMLNPAPIGTRRGGHSPTEPFVGVVLVERRVELLVPHRVGRHQVEAA